jgi:hypothetical protein
MRIRITAAGALCALLVAGIAAAEVTVYENPFSSRGSVRDLRKVEGGKECKRGWAKEDEELSLEIKKGAVTCEFSTPVRGDESGPDHHLEITATISKQLPKSLRDKVFASISVRNNQSAGYELRVAPGTSSWEVRRDPQAEGFPLRGTDNAIAGLGKSNKLSLQAFGDSITAAVNGKRVVDGMPDPAAADVEGRRTTIAFGSDGNAKDPIEARFDNLRVRLPSP